MEAQYDFLTKLIDQYDQKNSAYGNNAHNTYCMFGVVSYVIRLQDKANRYLTLIENQNIPEADESINDTLGDAITYACMASADLAVTDMENEAARDSDWNMSVTKDTLLRLRDCTSADIKGMSDLFEKTFMKGNASIVDGIYNAYKDDITASVFILIASMFLNIWNERNQ